MSKLPTCPSPQKMLTEGWGGGGQGFLLIWLLTNISQASRTVPGIQQALKKYWLNSWMQPKCHGVLLAHGSQQPDLLFDVTFGPVRVPPNLQLCNYLSQPKPRTLYWSLLNLLVLVQILSYWLILLIHLSSYILVSPPSLESSVNLISISYAFTQAIDKNFGWADLAPSSRFLNITVQWKAQGLLGEMKGKVKSEPGTFCWARKARKWLNINGIMWKGHRASLMIELGTIWALKIIMK